jgi:uncharacterized spore protein YtfJ
MSETNHLTELLKGVVGELRQIATSEAVIGEPVTVGGRTVIPVVKLSVGFGAGGGQGENEKAGAGFGGGGGGGAKIEPIAFVILDETGPSVLTVSKGKWESVIDSIPGLAKKLGKLADSLISKSDNSGKADSGTSSDESSDEPA